MKATGYLMLVAGFLAAAFYSVTDAVEVPWPAYLGAMALGALGVLAVRRQRRVLARSEAVLVRQRKHIDESLGRVVAGLERMVSGQQAVPPWELRFEIDRCFRDDLALFADARDSLAHIYGLKVYAEVMSAFAAGERYLNRVWSASADGYMDEAVAYLDRALEQFRQAGATLETARIAA
jgi:hypothetical protein